MDEENNEQNQEQNKQSNSVEKFAKDSAMNVGKNIGKKVGKKGLQALRKGLAQIGKAVISFVAAHIVPIAIIVLIVCCICILIPAIDDFLDQETAQTIDDVTYQTIQEYCTIDDTGIHFDKQSFLDNIIKNLQDTGIDLSDLGLGDYGTNTSGTTNYDTNSEAAQYLYEFISASLAGELPYIPGSDEETQGIIKIKRQTSTQQQTQTSDDNKVEVDTTKRTIDTASYGLSAENVEIVMDNISKEYKIAWISDLHMMQPDETSINTAWYTKHSTTFEERNSIFNNSYAILPDIIDCLNANNFDAVVFGGDIMDNYSSANYSYLTRQISRLKNTKVMYLVADHDYLTEMTTNTGANESASSIGVSGDIKKITIGENGDSVTLIGQNYSNNEISDSLVSTISSYLNSTDNALFFTHVPVESKTQASEMQAWSKSVHNDEVYYWSTSATSSGYNNPSSNYLNTLYNSTSLRGMFAGHVHSSGEFELNTGITEHIFQASFTKNIGVITLTPSGTISERYSNTDSDDGTAIDLTYIGYEKFQQMLQSTDNSVKDNIMKYFSIDESWNLCIAKYYKQTIDGTLTEYTITEVKIPYRNLVSQYTVPFMFLIDLQLITNNATYVEAVSELMTKQSEIVFTIFDNVTTFEDTYTYSATRNSKSLVGTPASGWEIAAGLAEGQHYETSSSDITEQTITRTETDNIIANVTSANTWIVQQTTDYVLQSTTEVNDTSEDCSESEPSGEGSWDSPATKSWHDVTTTNEYVKSGDTKTKILPSKFMGLWSNETGTYVKGAEYKAVGYGKSGKVVAYNLRNSNSTDRPIINIVTSRESLYELLESSTTTQTHAEYMREFINLYMNGEELDENTFSSSTYISMFEPTEYTEYSYTGDFDVHDESLFITDIDTLKKAFSGGYSSNSKLIANAQAFLDMQSTYKVNALFAAAVSVTETSAGTKGNAVNGCNNWFNITGTNGPYKTTTNSGGETHNWRIYESDAEGIKAFGNLIANGSYYYAQGNYTVSAIAQHYCPNTTAYPTQAYTWSSNTIAQISRFYSAAGMDTSNIINVSTESTVTVVGSQDLKSLFPSGVPTTENAMKQYLTTVTIDINDENGNKTTRKLTVHKAVANAVIEIFKEIQQSGFRIKSVGAYSWRSAAASTSRSHHSYGVAIDINPNENYMIKGEKIISGSFWKPGVNQYSITSNGAVVQAFAKRGWTWGGTWKSSKDYMHFSLTGH
jgi:predicted MPP superfamily phosphohydrolase